MPDAVILLGVAGCVGFLAFGVARIAVLDPPFGHLLAFGLPAALAVALLLALRLPRPTRVKIALALGSGCVSVFAAELFFQVADSPTPSTLAARAASAARGAGRPFDARTTWQVVSDLRAQGLDAMPFPRPPTREALTLAGSNGRALPVLGGVSDVMTVHCNESGEFMTYLADEHGFNNPPGLHGRSPLQVALIGDSFTHGNCVAREDSIAGHLRRAFPDTLNLGIGGSGPLSQLARFVEYAAPLRPRFVVWLFYEGSDLSDLRRELSRPPLRRYFSTPTPLGLRHRQADINDTIRAALDSAALDSAAGLRTNPLREVRRLLTLGALRRRVETAGLPLSRAGRDGPALDKDLAVVERILAGVRDTARGWDGEVVMVYLRHAGPDLPSPARERLFGIFERLDLPVVDAHAAFATSGRPPETFRYYPGSHYSPAGYRVVADAVQQELQTRLAGSAAAPSQR